MLDEAHPHQHDGKGCWRDNVFVERPWKTLDRVEPFLQATMERNP